MIDGFDQLLEQLSKPGTNETRQTKTDRGNSFNQALGTITEHELRNAARNKSATATASFLYGAWSAYNEGAEIPEENLPVLHKQVSEMITGNETLLTSLRDSAPEKRRKLYEYLAMTGNWMVMFQDTFQNNPDQNTVDTIKNIAKELLFASFKINADDLHISKEGKLSVL